MLTKPCLDSTIVIEIAGVPKGKGRPRFARMGSFVRTYTDDKTRSYEGALSAAGSEAMRGRRPIEGPVAVLILAFMPVPASWSKRKRGDALAGRIRPTTKPDFDNLAKTLDALNEIVFRDDKQIVDGCVRKHYSDRPRLQVRVEAA